MPAGPAPARPHAVSGTGAWKAPIGASGTASNPRTRAPAPSTPAEATSRPRSTVVDANGALQPPAIGPTTTSRPATAPSRRTPTALIFPSTSTSRGRAARRRRPRRLAPGRRGRTAALHTARHHSGQPRRPPATDVRPRQLAGRPSHQLLLPVAARRRVGGRLGLRYLYGYRKRPGRSLRCRVLARNHAGGASAYSDWVQ